MKREKVTYEEVVTACENLLERGDTPSVRNVLQEVGGGGSQTIAGHLTTWRQNQAASEEAREAIASQHISGDLVQSLLREIDRHKDQAVEGMKKQLATVYDDINALREELDRERVDMEEVIRRADEAERELASARQQMSTEAATRAALLGESQRRIAKLEEELEAATGHLAQERVTTAQLQAKVSTSQARQDELVAAARKTDEIEDELRQDNKVMHQAAAQMQFAVFEAEKKAAVAVEQVNSRDAAIKKLEASLQAAEQGQRAMADRQHATSEKLEAAVRRADIAEARLHVHQQSQRTMPRNGEGEGAEANSN